VPLGLLDAWEGTETRFHREEGSLIIHFAIPGMTGDAIEASQKKITSHYGSGQC
jgi:hypothetical protein